MKPILAAALAATLGFAMSGACSTSSPTKNDGGGGAGGSGGSAGKDGAAEMAADTTPDMAPVDMAKEGVAGACDPFAQDCMMGQKCDITCAAGGASASLGCVTDSGSGGSHGDTCSGTMACKKGGLCLTTSMVSKCRQYCDKDADCPMGKTCASLMITVTCGGVDAGTGDGGMPPMLTIHACAL